MATIIAKVGENNTPINYKAVDCLVYTWTSLTESDTAVAVSFPAFTDKSIQVVGTFGGATIALHGSNDGVNFCALTYDGANAIAITSATSGGIKAVNEATLWIKPVASGGTSQSVTIMVFGRR